MGSRGGLGLLARLELRHARSGLRFLLFAAGADIDEDRGFLERAYQLYLALILLVALVLSWAQVIYLVEGMRDALGSVAGSISLALLGMVPAAALAAWTLAALREAPLRLSAADIAWLARVANPRDLLVVRLVRELVAAAAVGALGGSLLGTLALAPDPLGWPALAGVLLASVRLIAMVAGLARCAAARSRRLAVSLVAAGVTVLHAVGLGLLLPALVLLLGLGLAPGALVLDFALVAAALWLASRADMAFVVDDNELYAARRSLRFLSFVDAGAYKEACRRRRSGRRRQARRTWRFPSGRAALASHALVSLLRRPSALIGILTWGALIAPAGAFLVAARANVGVLLSWLVCATYALREPVELAHVFREDCRNRLVSAQLPAGPLALLALDSAPALAVAFAASAAVVIPVAALVRASVVPTLLLAWAMLAAVTLAAGYDDPRRARRSGSFRVTAFMAGVLALFATGLAGPFGVVPALVCALATVALLARSLCG